MKQVIIENPVLNSPFEVPQRHFKFDDEGITNEIVESRRSSAYFIPIAKPKMQGKQLRLDAGWTEERIRPNDDINRIRAKVDQWRQGNHVGITKTTRMLLDYWTNPEREKRLFFCQIEAAETAIYITEVANKYGDAWIDNTLRQANEDANPLLSRVAFKMATGSGKTVVMGMLIAWQALNKLANPQDGRFSDAFLIVTPGITIRDRLRVLLPNDPQNYYRERDILPTELMQELEKAKIVIANFHGFLLREHTQAAKLTKQIITRGKQEESPFKETPDQMVRRVCRELGSKKNIVVLNDEAHHCYRRRKGAFEEEQLRGDERKEAEKREEAARVWISGLEAVKAKIGIKVVYDLSATPFFLRGSGYDEGKLFPWVVSDFALIDAIESGIVKVPRVPVADDAMRPDQPTYRDLWHRIRDNLPKKGRGTEPLKSEPKLPKELQGALHSLYGNYEKYHRRWEHDKKAQAEEQTPPVFIVVCNNTNVSKLVYDYVAGWEKRLGYGGSTPPSDVRPKSLRAGRAPLGPTDTVLVPGELPIFSNVEDGLWLSRPNTVLIDSEQLESGEAMSAEFKKIAAVEIEEFKADYRRRFPGRDVEALTDEDLLREVMNTVGKAGKLGEHVKCVVSVSMLTEGWDANTVTHILGVRAFGTQLLCEQVVGRGLRRMGYATERQTVKVNGKEIEFDGYPTQYAEVYGVPFSFIPAAGSAKEPKPGPAPKRVRALEERAECEITFPRLAGYRFDFTEERLAAVFSGKSELALSTADVPTKTENAPIVGEGSIHTLGLEKHRLQEVDFQITKRVLEEKFRDDAGSTKPWLFPQLLEITKQWRAECLICKDNTFPQMLLLHEHQYKAVERIYTAIVASTHQEKILKPILRPYDSVGSTRYVDFDTIRPTYETRPDKCQINRVVADTESWEQKLAQTLEEMDEVISYAKNDHVGFTIPYTFNGQEENYRPDFIARINDGHGGQDAVNLILEVTGARDEKKATKVSTAQDLWVEAVNNHGGFGRWGFIEIADPWNAKGMICAALKYPV